MSTATTTGQRRTAVPATKADLFRIPNGEVRVLLGTDAYLVETDERTLWVYGPRRRPFGCFSPQGIDIHEEDGHRTTYELEDPSFDFFAILMSQRHHIDVRPFRTSLLWLPS